MIFQDYALFPWMSVFQNIVFGLEMKSIVKEERNRIARHHLELVGLGGFEDKLPHHYPAACASAWRSRARWRSARACY
jgi:NitT/TauT family transport system ATP-binding protein